MLSRVRCVDRRCRDLVASDLSAVPPGRRQCRVAALHAALESLPARCKAYLRVRPLDDPSSSHCYVATVRRSGSHLPVCRGPHAAALAGLARRAGRAGCGRRQQSAAVPVLLGLGAGLGAGLLGLGAGLAVVLLLPVAVCLSPAQI